MPPVRVLVPTETAAGFKYPQVLEVNYIDREVFAKLKRLNMVPSDLASDAEFLRRVTLDTIGALPSPKDVRDFAADTRADKRAQKIDELLAHPLHAALWATKFSDITGNNTAALENPQQFQPKLSQMWHDWLREAASPKTDPTTRSSAASCVRRAARMTPEEYVKQFDKEEAEAKEGVTTTYQERATLDLFWRRQQQVTVDQWGEKTAAAFLGVRLECPVSQAPLRPLDAQSDYRVGANVFAAVTSARPPIARSLRRRQRRAEERHGPEEGEPDLTPVVYVGPGGKRAASPYPIRRTRVRSARKRWAAPPSR